MQGLSSDQITELTSALNSSRCTSGATHNYYLYPARFSPEFARTIIKLFSQPSDWVFDPFMGGGTTLVEALMQGRRVIGVDVNQLACFVANVRTSPLSQSDYSRLNFWAKSVSSSQISSTGTRALGLSVLPGSIRRFLGRGITATEYLQFRRQKMFARCVLLRLGQWALDCRDVAPSEKRLEQKLLELTCQMLTGLDEFVDACRNAGVGKSEIRSRRLLYCGDTAKLAAPGGKLGLREVRPKLILTSPPYPRVHVLYHRWQIRSRKETSAPYWVANVSDGHPASYYTGGSRSDNGETTYFNMITSVFGSMRDSIASDALVVQLVGFSDIASQLPRYLDAMSSAGFVPSTPLPIDSGDLWRCVPNRKWHARLQSSDDASRELLLFHRPLK